MGYKLTKKLRAAVLLWMVLLSLASFVYTPEKAAADLILNRSLSLTNVTSGAVTAHTVSFDFPSNSSVGSLVFDYCTSPVEDVPCVRPTGLDASAATLTAQSGETGFSILSQTNRQIILTRPPAITIGIPNSYTFSNVTNPNVFGPFFLRISSYASSDGTGPKTDFGATAGSINQGVFINTEVPPILEFCVGVSVIGQCDSAEGDILHLGTFRTTTPSYGTTQFAAATNAEFGYVVTVNGHTLTSGVNAIPSLASPTISQIGKPQFGINLRANTVPAVGANPGGSGGGPAPNYDISNSYTFNDGDVVAISPSVAGYQTYTVSYLVNIDKTQTPGVYSTTLNYLVTATF